MDRGGPALLASAYHLALALTVLASLALAVLIRRKAAAVAGARPLTLFVSLVAVWVAGLDLPWWLGPRAAPLATALIALAPLGGAAFLHFAAVFGGWRAERMVAAGYAVGAAGVAAGLAGGMGRFQPWPGPIDIFVPGPGGWATMLSTVGLAVAGHGLLWAAWRGATGLRRHQLEAVKLSGLWGLASISGMGFPSFGLPWFPVTVLLLPGYTLFLVYGILRYRLMEVNLWARRTLAWGLLTLAALASVGALAAVPAALVTEGGWAAVALAVVVALVLDQPARALANRIVYPGASIAPGDLERWRAALAVAQDKDDLARRAAAALGGQLDLTVTVSWAENSDGPGLLLRHDGVTWRCAATGWDEAPPGPLHVAQTFAGVLAEAANRLEHSLTLAARERERQQRERLAELGALAATVAHDLRNPMNIVAMTIAGAAPDIRREVSEQISRMDRLVRDLLDYAKPWQVSPRPVDPDIEIAAAAQGLHVAVDVPPGMTLHADPRRFNQALTNLLLNAHAAAPAAEVAVIAEPLADGGALLHVCDKGAGVPADIRDRLFQPFVSRSPDGTGLGLAIVAKAMAAHGGSAELTERPGWSTCITLRFPGGPPCDPATS